MLTRKIEFQAVIVGIWQVGLGKSSHVLCYPQLIVHVACVILSPVGAPK